MGKSKFQAVAKTSIENKAAGKPSRPKYYDEEFIAKKNGAKGKNTGYAIFIGLIVVIGVSVVGVGSYLDNQKDAENNEDSTLNTNYIEYTPLDNDNSASGGYKSAISITTIDGTVINLADHAGKVVVLFFHFLSCSPCHSHAPELNDAASKFSSNEVLVISISVQAADSASQLREWKNSNGFNFELVKDTDYALSSRFGAQYTPHCVYLAKDGDASEQQTGIKSSAEIQQTISTLLAA